jgi:hypothetical protein
MVAELRDRRAKGAGYPVGLGTLIDAAGAPDSGVVKRALALGIFRLAVIPAVPSDPDTPVALAGDQEQLAAAPLVLTRAVAATRTAENQAVPVGDVTKKLARDLHPAFAAAVARQIASAALPAGVGCLHIKKKPHLFLLEDVGKVPPVRETPPSGPLPETGRGSEAAEPPRLAAGADRTVSPEPRAGASGFALLFDQAFARLDQEHGSPNLVSLVQLRQEVPVGRGTFDEGLDQLRRLGRYSLQGAEGRHGISAEERAAGIEEHGHLLLFVSRREA